MKDIIAPFLERFKHPIFSSIFGSFFIWNIDLIVPTTYIFFKGSEALFNLTFMETLWCFKSDIYRTLIPISSGLIYSFLLLPGFDSLYGIVLAFWMRRKNNGIEKQNERVLKNLANYREVEIKNILLSLEKETNLEYGLDEIRYAFFKMAKLRFFRTSDMKLKNHPVFFEKNEKLLRKIRSNANRPVGICIGYLSERYAVVAIQGKILFNNSHPDKQRLYLSSNGSLTTFETDNSFVGRVEWDASLQLFFLNLNIEDRQDVDEINFERLVF